VAPSRFLFSPGVSMTGARPESSSRSGAGPPARINSTRFRPSAERLRAGTAKSLRETTTGTTEPSASRGPRRRPSAPRRSPSLRGISTYNPGGFPPTARIRSPPRGTARGQPHTDSRPIKKKKKPARARATPLAVLPRREHLSTARIPIQKPAFVFFAGEYPGDDASAPRPQIHGEQAGVVSVDSARDPLRETSPFTKKKGSPSECARRGEGERALEEPPFPPRAR